MCCCAGCLQVSARRGHLTAPARSLSGIATSGGSISISGARTDAALRSSAAASGMRLAVGVGAMALEALTAFRLHRLYTDGVVLSKSSAAVRGFAFRGSQVGALARCACREARCRVAALVFKGMLTSGCHLAYAACRWQSRCWMLRMERLQQAAPRPLTAATGKLRLLTLSQVQQCTLASIASKQDPAAMAELRWHAGSSAEQKVP